MIERLWNDFELRRVGRPIDQKIAAVDGEDPVNLCPFAGGNQSGIGEIHWKIGVLLDELAHSPKVRVSKDVPDGSRTS